MKKLITLLCLFSLPFTALAGKFSDVPDTYPYAFSINLLAKTQLISGYPDNTFRPENLITRAEFIKLLLTANKIDVTNIPTNCFPDIKKTDWFAPYVCYAKKNNIITGYPDGRFRPNNNISVNEVLKILILSNRDLKDQLCYENWDTLFVSGFTRQQCAAPEYTYWSKTDPWYKNYVDFAKKYHLYLKDWGNNTNQSLTRGEMVELLIAKNLWFYLYYGNLSTPDDRALNSNECIEYSHQDFALALAPLIDANAEFTGNGYSKQYNMCLGMYYIKTSKEFRFVKMDIFYSLTPSTVQQIFINDENEYKEIIENAKNNQRVKILIDFETYEYFRPIPIIFDS